jgi:hypothetical protein
MKQLIFILTVIVLLSCGTNEQANVVDSATSVGSRYTGVTDLQPLRPNIDLTPWEGSLYDAAYWRDSKGENIIIISGNAQYFWADEKPELEKRLESDQDADTYEEATDIYARHYVLKAGESKWELKYEYYDVLLGCCDVFMEYQPGTLEIQDADSNEVGDMLFTYQTTEGDGKMDGRWNGREVLLIDSAQYAVRGLSASNSVDEVSDQLSKTCPPGSVYCTVMEEKWIRDCDAWNAILRARSTAMYRSSAITHYF